jgi:hypothetical protein
MEEILKIAANGQWSLEKAKPMSSEEMKAFKEKRDAHMRREHGMPPKEEHQKELDASRSRNTPPPKTSMPATGHNADKKYNERFHSATRETAPGKFIYQGMPKKPPADVIPPKSKQEFHGKGFERSPVRMSPMPRKK